MKDVKKFAMDNDNIEGGKGGVQECFSKTTTEREQTAAAYVWERCMGMSFV